MLSECMLYEENVKDKKKCLYGDEKHQAYLELGKAWTDYYNLSKEKVPDKKRKRHYERIINNIPNEKKGEATAA